MSGAQLPAVKLGTFLRLCSSVLQSKEKLLTDLRKELQITTQEHFEVLTAVMQDKEIEALRENRVLEPQPAAADAGLLKRKKDAMGGRYALRMLLHDYLQEDQYSVDSKPCRLVCYDNTFHGKGRLLCWQQGGLQQE